MSVQAIFLLIIGIIIAIAAIPTTSGLAQMVVMAISFPLIILGGIFAFVGHD